MRHEMKLTEGPFGRMEAGRKTLELRLYDEKRQKIQLGDEILFSLLPSVNRTLLTKVTGLLVYPTFSEMLSDLSPELLGYEEKDRSYLKTSMYEIYTPEEEKKYGVLGIRLHLVPA